MIGQGSAKMHISEHSSGIQRSREEEDVIKLSRGGEYFSAAESEIQDAILQVIAVSRSSLVGASYALLVRFAVNSVCLVGGLYRACTAFLVCLLDTLGFSRHIFL